MTITSSALKNFQLVPANASMYERFFIWLVVGGAAFSYTIIIPGVSLADVFFLCVFIFCLSHVLVQEVIHIPQWFLYVVFLLISAFIGGLAISSFSKLAFSELEFVKSFVKLSFYSVGSLFLSIYIGKIEIACIGKAILNILTLNAVIAIYIYAVMQFPIELPYEFFWFGQQGPVTAGYFGGFESGFVRARGLFSEPSNLGIFQTMGLAFLYFKTQILNKFCWKYLIILFSVLLTFSMTGYFLLSIAMLVFYRQNLKRYIIPTILILTILILITPLRDVFHDTIIVRLLRVFQGLDQSANARLFASWEIPLKIISISPIFGAGLGNLENAFATLNYDLTYGYILVGNPQGWNVLAYVLGTMGVIGFIIFVMFIVRLIIMKPSAGIFFVCFMFTTGSFLEPLLWIYYVLYSKPVMPMLGKIK